MSMNFLDAAGVLADSAMLLADDTMAIEAQDIVQAVVDAYDALAPNWSDAPEWAKWSAVHGNGLRYWFQVEPEYSHGYTGWDRKGGRIAFDNEVELPFGVDWRLTKQPRPEIKL
jgi:hypothetical protein